MAAFLAPLLGALGGSGGLGSVLGSLGGSGGLSGVLGGVGRAAGGVLGNTATASQIGALPQGTALPNLMGTLRGSQGVGGDIFRGLTQGDNAGIFQQVLQRGPRSLSGNQLLEMVVNSQKAPPVAQRAPQQAQSVPVAQRASAEDRRNLGAAYISKDMIDSPISPGKPTGQLNSGGAGGIASGITSGLSFGGVGGGMNGNMFNSLLGGVLGKTKDIAFGAFDGIKNKLTAFKDGVMDWVHRPLGKVSELFQSFNSVLYRIEAPMRSLESIFRHISTYVGAFNPATASYFDRAVKDLEASIGEVLVPVLRKGTELFRWLGDSIAGMTPVVKPLVSGLVEMADKFFRPVGQLVRTGLDGLKSVGRVFGELFAATAPLQSSLGSVFGSAVKFFGQMVGLVGDLVSSVLSLGTGGGTVLKTVFSVIALTLDGLSTVLNFLAKGIQILRKLTGGPLGGADTFTGSSVGKAYVSTQTETTQSYLSRMQQDAFGLGSESPEQKMTSAADKMSNAVDRLATFFETRFPETLKGLSLGNVTNTFSNAAQSVAHDYLGTMRAAIGTLGGGL